MTWDSGACRKQPLETVPVPVSGWDSGACASPPPEPVVTDPGIQRLLGAIGEPQARRMAAVESLNDEE